ncbi:MAG: hypothetical protein LUF34_09660 [Lachnospiraceae bacterium]|nr:hypothetical protein [Lachnospiraceae bacterium]
MAVGVFCAVGFCWSINSIFWMSGIVSTSLEKMISLIILLNRYDKLGKKEFVIDYSLQSLIVILLALSTVGERALNIEPAYIGVVMCIFVILELFLRIMWFSRSTVSHEDHRYRNVEDLRMDKVIREFVFDRLIGNKTQHGTDELSAITLWNVSSVFIVLLLYLGKYILDIANIMNETYSIPWPWFLAWGILGLLLLYCEYQNHNYLHNNYIHVVLLVLLLEIGAFIFLFLQTEEINGIALLAAGYCIAPYILYIHDTVNILNAKWNQGERDES